MAEKTTNITSEHRREDSYNNYRSILISGFHNYMQLLSSPTSHMHSLNIFNNQKEESGHLMEMVANEWVLSLTLDNGGFNLS